MRQQLDVDEMGLVMANLLTNYWMGVGLLHTEQ